MLIMAILIVGGIMPMSALGVVLPQGWLDWGASPLPERTTSAQELACLVDALAYAGGSEDPGLTVLFGQADKRRAADCGPAAASVAAR